MYNYIDKIVWIEKYNKKKTKDNKNDDIDKIW